MNPLIIQAQLQTALPILLPMIASGLSYLFQQNKYPNWVNGVIATSAILLASVATLFAGGKLTGDVYGDAALAFTTATALQAETFAPLQKYIRANWFAHLAQAQIDPQATLPRPTVKSPQPIELGTKAYVPRPVATPTQAPPQSARQGNQVNPTSGSGGGSVHGG